MRVPPGSPVHNGGMVMMGWVCWWGTFQTLVKLLILSSSLSWASYLSTKSGGLAYLMRCVYKNVMKLFWSAFLGAWLVLDIFVINLFLYSQVSVTEDEDEHSHFNSTACHHWGAASLIQTQSVHFTPLTGFRAVLLEPQLTFLLQPPTEAAKMEPSSCIFHHKLKWLNQPIKASEWEVTSEGAAEFIQPNQCEVTIMTQSSRSLWLYFLGKQTVLVLPL